jgi:hypothetical protein
MLLRICELPGSEMVLKSFWFLIRCKLFLILNLVNRGDWNIWFSILEANWARFPMKYLLTRDSDRCFPHLILVWLVRTPLQNVPLSHAFILDFNLPSGNWDARYLRNLGHICAITIPSRVKRIDDAAFKKGHLLRVIQFELPSQFWCISTVTFNFCPLLESISLPLSVEFIEHAVHIEDGFVFLIDGLNFLIRDDCLMHTNGREPIRYLDSWQTFCVSREITVLAAESFRKCSSLTTLVFDRPSPITYLPDWCFSYCSGLPFVEIPNLSVLLDVLFLFLPWVDESFFRNACHSSRDHGGSTLRLHQYDLLRSSFLSLHSG